MFGWIHYRSQMNILTGWIHHSAYTTLLCLILYLDFQHVFALAAFMEVRAPAPLITKTRD